MAKDSTSSLNEIKNKINADYKDIEVLNIKEVSKGQVEMDVKVNHNKGLNKSLASISKDKALRPHSGVTRGAASIVTRDNLSRGDLGLVNTSVLDAEPSDLFSRSIDYYKTKGIYGSYIDALTDFACKGFENDIDDPDIKLFFDSWVFDTSFEDIVWGVFFDFFRVGFVRTYKVFGKYEPKINPFRFPGSDGGPTPTKTGDGVPKSAKGVVGYGSFADVLKMKKMYEKGARKNVWAKSFIPMAYTILNPTLIEITGSMLFGQETVVIKSAAFDEVRKIMDKPAGEQTISEKQLLKTLPKEWMKLIKEREDIPLDPVNLGAVDYRKMPYERYPVPRGAKAFESINYKESLTQADYSTLDGISNYILKITVGTDEHPVTTQSELEKVADLFNTPSKSFDVVWNHTLNVEKITFPEISGILGPEKYQQVNTDLDGSFGIRGLIDGSANGNAESVKLATKRLIEEVNYARKRVSRWIYNEYISIAEAMGFERIPFIRFDDMALRDEVLMMSIVQGLIDRRIISYNTGLRKLGFDPKTILAELQEEKPLVLNGDIGIIGSPYNPAAAPQLSDTQQTPKGTPSEGRPKKGGGKPKTKDTKTTQPKVPKAQQAASVGESVEELSGKLKKELVDSLTSEELFNLVGDIIKNRED